MGRFLTTFVEFGLFAFLLGCVDTRVLGVPTGTETGSGGAGASGGSGTAGGASVGGPSVDPTTSSAASTGSQGSSDVSSTSEPAETSTGAGEGVERETGWSLEIEVGPDEFDVDLGVSPTGVFVGVTASEGPGIFRIDRDTGEVSSDFGIGGFVPLEVFTRLSLVGESVCAFDGPNQLVRIDGFSGELQWQTFPQQSLDTRALLATAEGVYVRELASPTTSLFLRAFTWVEGDLGERIELPDVPVDESGDLEIVGLHGLVVGATNVAGGPSGGLFVDAWIDNRQVSPQFLTDLDLELDVNGGVVWLGTHRGELYGDDRTPTQSWVGRVFQGRTPEFFEIAQGESDWTPLHLAVSGSTAYIAGMTGDGTTRIEHRSLVSGDLIPPFGESGALEWEFAAALHGLEVDGSELFVAGRTSTRVLVQRRRASDGAP